VTLYSGCAACVACVASVFYAICRKKLNFFGVARPEIV